MEKLDLSKKHKAYYRAKSQPELVEIEPIRYLSITGKGDPSGTVFLERIQALYSTIYPLKFECKALGSDFVVPKLEALWHFDETKFMNFTMAEAPIKIPRSEWEYRLLIRLPVFVSEQQIGIVKEKVKAKKQIKLADEVGLFAMNEGKVVQMLHVGPFDKEYETLLQMQEFIQARRLQKNGLHHEIYLSDFNKTTPEKLRTILREPVK